MISPPSVPATQAGATGSLTQDAAPKIGAFDVPKTATPAGGSVVAAGRSPTTPQTNHLAINAGTGDVQKSSKPVEIPQDVSWQKPVTAIRASGQNKAGATGRAVITYVPDGDTAYGKDGLKCRIDGIDAPETAHDGKKGQAYGEEAGKALRDMVLNKEVTVRITKPTLIQPGEQPSKTNNYGRDLCQIEIEGKNVSAEMVKSGAAWLYQQFNNDPRLKASQDAAEKNKQGLWANENPIAPWAFRRMQNYGQLN